MSKLTKLTQLVLNHRDDCQGCVTCDEIARLRNELNIIVKPATEKSEEIKITIEQYVKLRYIDKMLVREIAEQFGTTRSRLSSYAYRHKSKINEILDKLGILITN